MCLYTYERIFSEQRLSCGGGQLWMRIVLFLPFLKWDLEGSLLPIRGWAVGRFGLCEGGSADLDLWTSFAFLSVKCQFPCHSHLPNWWLGGPRFSPQSMRSLDPACNSLLMPSWWTKPPIRCTQRPLLTPCCLIQCNWPCHYGCLAVLFPVSACTPTV